MRSSSKESSRGAARHPRAPAGPEVAEQLSLYQANLAEKTKQMKAMTAGSRCTGSRWRT